MEEVIIMNVREEKEETTDDRVRSGGVYSLWVTVWWPNTQEGSKRQFKACIEALEV